MPDTTRPNWVKEQAECEVEHAFQQVCDEVETDANAMQPYVVSAFPPQTTLNVERQRTTMTVRCESVYAGVPFVVSLSFDRPHKSLTISVAVGHTVKQQEIRPAWNPKRERCEMVADDRQAYEPWQVSRLILQPLFFPESE